MEFHFSLDTIKETAIKFWKETSHAKVLAFHGQMGAGKTTFIHALCDVKGIKDTVGSPYFFYYQ
ncbi:MAG: tRNA (adenosine(37)-N6)-threonylcarbamoyltransferase complex ATPase subunit type 1 TsaE [Bacteroidota bacterium]